MLERGEKATVAAVHRELGGGSFSTLSPIMKDWRQGREAAAALPPGLDALAELTKLWEAAWRAADRYHEAAREGWERERAALMVEISEREEIIAVIEEEMAAMSEAERALVINRQELRNVRQITRDRLDRLARNADPRRRRALPVPDREPRTRRDGQNPALRCVEHPRSGWRTTS